MNAQTAAANAAATRPRPPLLDARILLVDDDPGAIQWLSRVLAGYAQLRFAMSGDEALQLAAGWRPELVLLDAEMPGMSGFEVFSAMQADPLLADVPVIFVTQHADAGVETAVFEQGAADFVSKPVTGPALRARVAMHLRLGRLTRALAALEAQDGLTGLAKRQHLDERLAAECARAQRSGRALSLLLADVDHFRAYNEHRGTGAGDDCLRQVAGLLRDLAQRPGDLAARDGADAFALLLPDTQGDGAQAVAARFAEGLRALGLPHPASPAGSWVTASVGVGTLAVRLDGAAASDGPLALRQAAWAALLAARASVRDGAGAGRTAPAAGSPRQPVPGSVPELAAPLPQRPI